jgi:hypothetical protein
MGWDLHIIRANEFIRLDAYERLDLEASKALLATLARACIKRGVRCALIDLRGLPEVPVPQFTANDLDALVRAFADAGFNCGQRLAILYRRDVHGDVRKFAFISRMRGLNVQAFSDFESAVGFLSGAEVQEVADQRQDIPVEAMDAEKEPRPRRIKIMPKEKAHAVTQRHE